MTLTAGEIQALKSGKITEDELFDKQIEEQKLELKKVESARDFILGRAKNTVECIIESNGEAIAIEIYTKLSRKELKKNKRFVEAMTKGDTKLLEGDELAAKFLATITVDDELDADFWLSDEIDTLIPATIMSTYMQALVENTTSIKKFR
jgi:cellobiose-specific phosphotransferase system component IIA